MIPRRSVEIDGPKKLCLRIVGIHHRHSSRNDLANEASLGCPTRDLLLKAQCGLTSQVGDHPRSRTRSPRSGDSLPAWRSSSRTAPAQPRSTISASIAASPSAVEADAPTGLVATPSDQLCRLTRPNRPPAASRIACRNSAVAYFPQEPVTPMVNRFSQGSPASAWQSLAWAARVSGTTT